jgi:hypothetical protein
MNGATHTSLTESQANAAGSSQAILDVVKAARGSTRLASATVGS